MNGGGTALTRSGKETSLMDTSAPFGAHVLYRFLGHPRTVCQKSTNEICKEPLPSHAAS